MTDQVGVIKIQQSTLSIDFIADSDVVKKFEKLGVLIKWEHIENRYTLIVKQEYNFSEIFEYVLLLLLLSKGASNGESTNRS